MDTNNVKKMDTNNANKLIIRESIQRSTNFRTNLEWASINSMMILGTSEETFYFIIIILSLIRHTVI